MASDRSFKLIIYGDIRHCTLRFFDVMKAANVCMIIHHTRNPHLLTAGDHLPGFRRG
jgi:hypothetical protein